MSPAPCPLPVLSPEWFERVEKAAREVENVSGNGHSSVGLAALLADIAVLRKHYAPKESVAFAPSRLYKALRDLYPERWRDVSDTSLGKMLRNVPNAEGRSLERKVVTAVHRNGKYVWGLEGKPKRPEAFFWEDLDRVTEAYGLTAPDE